MIFYCSFDLRYLFFLLFSAASTYLCALVLPKLARMRKYLLLLCLFANIGVWFVVKALPWTLEVTGNVLSIFKIEAPFGKFDVLNAVGLSYFTLQAVGYLVDVYKGKIHPEKNLLKYLLFISYFPAIVQGPISRYNELMPQLMNQKPFSLDAMRKGLILVLFGCIKKVVIADRLGIFVNACFNGFEGLTGVILYVAAVGYAVQLYMDFSGCVDICRGVSMLYNIELVNNFNRPYFATSIKEFWSKWHISLSRWLKDYVYIPLGGNRKGTFRKYLNLLITFLVSGLWHGAGFSFFLWGALHAVYQIIGQCTAGIRARIRNAIGVESGSVSERIYQTVITFNLVTLAWIFFRSATMMDGFRYLGQMFAEANLFAVIGGQMFQYGVSGGYFLLILLHLCVFFVVELCTKNQDSAIDGIIKQHVLIRWAVYLLLIFDVILFGAYGSGYDLSGFMYGGF